MDPITGIGLILALIPFWQRERDKKEAATKETFYAWLLEHKFESIKYAIETNSDLLIQIEDLLKLNQEDLLKRINSIDEKLLRILCGMEEFRTYVEKTYPHAILSKNEKNILIQFVESNDSELHFYDSNLRTFLETDGRRQLTGWDPRLIRSNLQNLVVKGFLIQREFKNGRIFYLTEDGIEYAAALKVGDEHADA